MKKLLFLFISFIIINSAKAQTRGADVPDLDKIEVEAHIGAKYTSNTEYIYMAVEKDPRFPGGPDKFYTYIRQNVQYPPDILKKGTEGKVFITFAVEKDGSLSNISVLRGVSPDMDGEVVRVVGNSPKWLPGIQDEKIVRVQTSMAINFKSPVQASSIDQEPQFPGGIEDFYNFIKMNLRYPNIDKQKGTQGKVFVSFVVDRDGSLTDIKVVKSLSRETDAEAIRLIQSSPKWTPGMQNGKAVRVQYTAPVIFSLQD